MFFLTRSLRTQCLLCKAPAIGRPLCHGCQTDLPWNAMACPSCALPLDAGICQHCQLMPPASRPYTRCAFLYQPPISQLLNRFKHNGQLECGRLLAELLADHLEQHRADSPAWPEVIVPVPLHWRRLQQRGFDQGLEIARVLAGRLSLPLCKSLRRHRHTPSQQGLGLHERQRNLQGAFSIRQPLAARHIALVDDVLTTGSTAAEISQLLFRQGAESIQRWAIARTPDPGSMASNA